MPYIKEVFDVTTFEQAKHTVLSFSHEDNNKFVNETNYLVDKIQETVSLDENSLCLDFGCGMGRVSKELIARFKCKVIGLDISPSMLMFAKLYTANMNKFNGTHNYTDSNSIDCALSILALQHSEDPKKEIDNIVNVLKPNGIFVLLNENKRFVPSGVDSERYVIWEDDKFDVFEYTEKYLQQIKVVPYIDNKLNIIFYKKN